MKPVLIVLSALFVFSQAIPSPQSFNNEVTSPSESTWMRIGREFSKCLYTVDDAVNCVALKGVTALKRAARQQSIELLPGVALVRDVPVNQRDGKSISDEEIEASLPQGTKDKTAKLLDMFIDSAVDFMSTHSIKMKLPQDVPQSFARALEEGRKKSGGKMGKLMGHMMMMMGAKFAIVTPIMLIGLLGLAIKALITSKIALALALAVGLPMLMGGGGGFLGGKGGSQGGWSQGGGGWSSSYSPSASGWSSGGPYSRSFGDDAQEVAYSAHKQQ